MFLMRAFGHNPNQSLFGRGSFFPLALRTGFQ
jgi:hypothetical protein